MHKKIIKIILMMNFMRKNLFSDHFQPMSQKTKDRKIKRTKRQIKKLKAKNKVYRMKVSNQKREER